ncbi:MAG: Heat shock protein [Candidatus Tokpelaia sp. JSC188]|nr:MAG: Heat shock protein [Candidatus Tokpelaia sp. JSC188]
MNIRSSILFAACIVMMFMVICVVVLFSGSKDLKHLSSQDNRPSLENTYWKLVRLKGQKAIVTENQSEPHLILHADQHSVSGSGGCNNVIGSYILDGERLKFTPMAGTMMACQSGMNQEHSILITLPTVTRWQIEGKRLRLWNMQGALVAEFDAVYLN